MYVQSSLDFLGKACEAHPHLRVKIAIDCVDKGYASHEQVSYFLGLSVECWQQFYDNFQEGDIHRVPEDLINLVPPRDLRFLTGFTDEQLDILERALDVPFIMSDRLDEQHPLSQELRVLMVFGVLLNGRRNQFKIYAIKVIW